MLEYRIIKTYPVDFLKRYRSSLLRSRHDLDFLKVTTNNWRGYHHHTKGMDFTKVAFLLRKERKRHLPDDVNFAILSRLAWIFLTNLPPEVPINFGAKISLGIGRWQ